MKTKLQVGVWFLFATLMLIAFVGFSGELSLNLVAVQSLKAVSGNVDIAPPPPDELERLDCHQLWLQEDRNLAGLLPCSPIYMDMIRDLAPADAILAAQARTLYPDLAEPLYWLAESNGGYSAPDNLPVYQQIVAKHPQEGLAWCYLGYQYESAGDLQASLDARINCCYNGDPGSNGCVNAGRLYEGMGDQENAIKYYLLSKWEPSIQKGRALLADRKR